MKMLILVFRSSFTDEVVSVLDSLKLPGYTEAPEVFGSGSEGRVFGSHAWPGHNTMVLSALEDRDFKRVAAALRSLAQASKREGETMPVRLFVLPCEQII